MSPKILNLLGHKQPTAALSIVENGEPISDLAGSLKRATSVTYQEHHGKLVRNDCAMTIGLFNERSLLLLLCRVTVWCHYARCDIGQCPLWKYRLAKHANDLAAIAESQSCIQFRSMA